LTPCNGFTDSSQREALSTITRGTSCVFRLMHSSHGVYVKSFGALSIVVTRTHRHKLISWYQKICAFCCTSYCRVGTQYMHTLHCSTTTLLVSCTSSSQIDLLQVQHRAHASMFVRQTCPHIYASMEPTHAAASRTVLSPPPHPMPARICTMSQRASTGVDTNAAAVGLFDAQVLQVQACPYLLVFI
jgi:hypothetical protein